MAGGYLETFCVSCKLKDVETPFSSKNIIVSQSNTCYDGFTINPGINAEFDEPYL